MISSRIALAFLLASASAAAQTESEPQRAWTDFNAQSGALESASIGRLRDRVQGARVARARGAAPLRGGARALRRGEGQAPHRDRSRARRVPAVRGASADCFAAAARRRPPRRDRDGAVRAFPRRLRGLRDLDDLERRARARDRARRARGRDSAAAQAAGRPWSGSRRAWRRIRSRLRSRCTSGPGRWCRRS